MSKPRTVFMGTPEIAVPALRTLAAMTAVQCVVTQPDRPAGRGHQLQASAVKIAALSLELPVWQPETLRGAEKDPHLQGADLFVVLAYGELLREAVLALPILCVNLHASLLPRWRGASPLQAAIRAGDPVTGVSVMRMVRALDAGPVFLSDPLPIAPRETLESLHDRMAVAAANALEKFLARWPNVSETPQDDSKVTMCRKLTVDDGHLDFTRSVVELDRWIRAYTPAPGCWALSNGERIRILAAEPAPQAPRVDPGSVLVHDQSLLVGAADGALKILKLQFPGKRALSAAEFLNGNRSPDRLG